MLLTVRQRARRHDRCRAWNERKPHVGGASPLAPRFAYRGPLLACFRYAPLSVRLVQASVRPGWTTAGEALRLLPGTCVEVTQDPDAPPEDLPTARELTP